MGEKQISLKYWHYLTIEYPRRLKIKYWYHLTFDDVAEIIGWDKERIKEVYPNLDLEEMPGIYSKALEEYELGALELRLYRHIRTDCKSIATWDLARVLLGSDTKENRQLINNALSELERRFMISLNGWESVKISPCSMWLHKPPDSN